MYNIASHEVNWSRFGPATDDNDCDNDNVARYHGFYKILKFP